MYYYHLRLGLVVYMWLLLLFFCSQSCPYSSVVLYTNASVFFPIHCIPTCTSPAAECTVLQQNIYCIKSTLLVLPFITLPQSSSLANLTHPLSPSTTHLEQGYIANHVIYSFLLSNSIQFFPVPLMN